MDAVQRAALRAYYESNAQIVALLDALDEAEAEVDRVKSKRLVSAIFGVPEDMECVQPFGLYRHRDVTGVSGDGKVVAHGAQFPDRTVVLRWTGEHASTVVWESLDVAMAVHGHDGATEVVWYAEDLETAADAEARAEKAEAARDRVRALCDEAIAESGKRDAVLWASEVRAAIEGES